MAQDNPAIQLDEDKAKQLATDLYPQIEDAKGSMATAFNQIKEGREYLEATSTRYDLPFEGACELVPPTVKASLFALQSELSPAILNPEPFLRCKFNGIDEQIRAMLEMMGIASDMSRQWEAFLQDLIYEKMRARQVFEWALYASLRDGAAPLLLTHDTVLRSVPAWQTSTTSVIDPMSGAMIPTGMRRKRIRTTKTVYDYPRVDLLPIEHFICYPSLDIDLRWTELVGARYNISGEDLRQGLIQGTYDSDAVRIVQQYQEDHPDADKPEDTLYSHQAATWQGVTTGGQLTVFEGVKRLPGFTDDEPGGDYWVTYHDKSQTLLQCRPLSEVFWHGERPFHVMRPYANIPGIRGDSVASSGAGFVQDAKMTLIRLGVDATALGVAPPVLVALSMYNKFEKSLVQNRRPFGIIPFPDHLLTGNRIPQPFAPGVDPRSIISMTALLDLEGQKASSASDTLKGVPTNDKRTAYENAQIFEQMKKLVGLMLEHCAQTVSDIGQQILELVKQYSDRESLSSLWARINRESSMPFELACAGDYTVFANGVSETSNRQLLFDRAMQLMQVASSDPTTWSDPEKRWKSLHEVFVRMGHRNPEEILGTMQDYVQRDMMQQQMALKQAMAGALAKAPQALPEGRARERE